MASRFQRFRETSKLLFFRRRFAGDSYEKCRFSSTLWNFYRVNRYHGFDRIVSRVLTRGLQSQWFSSSPELQTKPGSDSIVLDFIKAALDQTEGPNHCWLNNYEGGSRSLLKKNGTFLVLCGQFSGTWLTNSCDSAILFEKVKLLQQRFPQLRVLGLQTDGLTSSVDERSNLVQLVLRENITFPILLSNKAFDEVSKTPFYILFKDFKKPMFYQGKDLDFEVVNRAVEELHVQQNENSKQSVTLFKEFWKEEDVAKETSLCSLRNLLFCFPGCISADSEGDRIFVSDSNHHRIVVLNREGNFLDCIGSSPGFEDGVFESARLLHPAASFYHTVDNYLYIVDSENHAIRRADMKRRVVETLTPVYKKPGIWAWITDKMGWKSNDNSNTEYEELNAQTLTLPWHLLKSPDGSLLVIDRCFETLWIIDMDSGKIEEVINGFSNILEICGHQIMEKVSVLKQFPNDWSQQQAKTVCSPEELPYGGLISSFTNFQDELLTCDMVGQRIMKLSGEKEGDPKFQFSNFGVLGFPYWLQPHLETTYTEAVGSPGTPIDHVTQVSLLPGRVDIRLNVNVPAGTELVEKIQESCVLYQARGLAVVMSEPEEKKGFFAKFGSTQEFYDELDNLCFTTPESDPANEDNHAPSEADFQDDKVQIRTTVNTSPGSSEVIISTVLYLKLRREPDQPENNQEKYAAKIVDLLSSGTNGKTVRDSCIQFLLKSNSDLRDIIFMKPLHVRIKLESYEHPKCHLTKDIVLTETSFEVNVSL